MANPQKNKGDRNERAAVVELIAKAPDLIVQDAQRKLGAGRREDQGDLKAFLDVAVQVRAVADLGTALRSAALDSVVQAGNAGVPLGLGMVPIPGARVISVRWLACCISWPSPVEPDRAAVAVFGNPTDLIAHLRREDLGVPRHLRIGRLVRKNTASIYVAPIEAWLHTYRGIRAAATKSCSDSRAVNRVDRFGASRHTTHVSGNQSGLPTAV